MSARTRQKPFRPLLLLLLLHISTCNKIMHIDAKYWLLDQFDSDKFGNVQFNWLKLFHAFSVKFTFIFFMSVFIQSFHINTCKNYLCIFDAKCDITRTIVVLLLS